ncbi:MAG: sigma-54-dependent Fis family transcriptional regulator, partial [Myxococcales bacterium]|nr:sigma-54-dependent Fis family transcriptional regulator [Myxococcales bacterium]
LLRVLQEGQFEPLGTSTPMRVDVRILSATHRDLKKCVHEGTFREDLYYRLNVLDLTAPPLRERRADLPILVEHFLRRFAPDPDEPPSISPAAWAALTNHPFPGNVRELEHAIQHAVVLARGGELQMWHLPRDVAGPDADLDATQESDTLEPLASAIKAFEREYLLRALRMAGGKKVKAASMLGISRKNLWEKLKGHDISDDDVD